MCVSFYIIGALVLYALYRALNNISYDCYIYWTLTHTNTLALSHLLSFYFSFKSDRNSNTFTSISRYALLVFQERLCWDLYHPSTAANPLLVCCFIYSSSSSSCLFYPTCSLCNLSKATPRTCTDIMCLYLKPY